jgi:hypothetical protein
MKNSGAVELRYPHRMRQADEKRLVEPFTILRIVLREIGCPELTVSCDPTKVAKPGTPLIISVQPVRV